ncbi:MAG: hypothetical protein PHU27_12270 [Salinivirgaceae bacterium]|nr:hypothetical protein [Salinivirgaceae bacterium]MDD4748094.1 hypothetical protein [Salinivirgaceae bacterium]
MTPFRSTIATLALASFALMFSSCEKTELLPISTNETQLSDKDFGIKVEQFRTKVLDSRKNGSTETIHVAEAVTMMEAAFNYYHAFTGEDYTFTITDTTIIPLNYNNNDVIPFSELQTIFVNANNSMADKFEALKMANKHTMMFDLELKNNELYVMMTAGTVETQKVAQECINEAPFGETDYWKFGYYSEIITDALGQCGAYEGLNVGVSDAKWEQERAARKYRRGNYNHYNYYFFDVQTLPLYPEEGLTNIYWSNSETPQIDPAEMCVDPAMMNTNYQFVGEHIDYFYNQYAISATKQFSNIDLQITGLATPLGYHYVTYIYSISYGEKKKRTQPTEILCRL